MLPAAGAAANQLAQDILEIKDAQFATQKMIETKSDCTRQASSISRDDLDIVLHSLHCVVIEAPNDSEDEFEGNLEDSTEFGSLANKYEQQQQEEYLATLNREVSRPTICMYIRSSRDVKVLVASKHNSLPYVCRYGIQCTRRHLLSSKIILTSASL